MGDLYGRITGTIWGMARMYTIGGIYDMGTTIFDAVIEKSKTCIFLILSFLIALVLCFLMLFLWKQMGNTANEQKMVTDNSGTKMAEGPQLRTKSIRVKQGERVLLSQLAQAIDEYGNDISSQLVFRGLPEKKEIGRFPTAKAGIYEVDIQVKSPVSGKEISKKIQILVDGRVMV